MIVIIDNGKGANEIASIIRSSKVVKPSSIPDASAYIVSDGANANNKDVISFVKKNSKPLLAIGAGYLQLGVAFGSTIRPFNISGSERLTIKQRSPILLDLKKSFSVVCSQKHILSECPECFGPIASSAKNELAAIQHGASLVEAVENPLPLFGVHFNPESGGDGRKIVDNFVKFVEIWNKYHN
ncbi:MAG: hypothetical protein HZB67_02560 [Candidatus Aenigmarchaeota archaeon]|nr:hypothetical protein [Candidatus Aenigmarchaeota archaeon]